MSPQERSHAWLRDRGWIFQKTEQTVHVPDPEHPGRMKMFKRDLFLFADIVGVHLDTPGTSYFQVTAGMNNKGERQAKIEKAPASPFILRAGNRIELHIWRKIGPRGKRKLWNVARFQAIWNGRAIVWETIPDEIDDFDAPQPTQLTLV